MLPEIVEAKLGHRGAPVDSEKTMAGAPPKEAAPALLHSSPPKRLFGLANDVAPGKSDVVQIAIGPSGQFAPLALTVAPNVERLTDLRQKPGTMMIRHRFVCACGHFRLQK